MTRNRKRQNCRKVNSYRQTGLHSQGYSLPWKFPVVNFHSDSLLNNTWIPHDLYHQNLQLSMKQESLTHLLAEHGGRCCAPRWNNGGSACCNRLLILVNVLFWRINANILLGGVQRGIIHMCLWGCGARRDWKDSLAECKEMSVHCWDKNGIHFGSWSTLIHSVRTCVLAYRCSFNHFPPFLLCSASIFPRSLC